jgi:hypothetical protein
LVLVYTGSLICNCTSTHVGTQTYEHIHTHTHTHDTHTHTYIYIYIYIYKHTHAQFLNRTYYVGKSKNTAVSKAINLGMFGNTTWILCNIVWSGCMRLWKSRFLIVCTTKYINFESTSTLVFWQAISRLGYVFFSFLCMMKLFVSLIRLDFAALRMFNGDNKLWSSSLWSFSNSVASCLLCPRILLSTLFWCNSSLYFFLRDVVILSRTKSKG